MVGVREPYTKSPISACCMRLDFPESLLTKTHDNAVAKSFRMPHITFRLDDEVSHHLHGFGINETQVLLHDHILHEVLMDQLSTSPPLLAILHEQDMVTTANYAVADMRCWTVAVYV